MSKILDGFVNGRLSMKYKTIMLSGGYYYWAPKFKFGKYLIDQSGKIYQRK